MTFDPLTLLSTRIPESDEGPTRGGQEGNPQVVIYGIDPKLGTVESMVCGILHIMCGDDPYELGAWLATGWEEITVWEIRMIGTKAERQLIAELLEISAHKIHANTSQ